MTPPVALETASNLNLWNLEQISFIISLSQFILSSSARIAVDARGSLVIGSFLSFNGQTKIQLWWFEGSHQSQYQILRYSTYIHSTTIWYIAKFFF